MQLDASNLRVRRAAAEVLRVDALRLVGETLQQVRRLRPREAARV